MFIYSKEYSSEIHVIRFNRFRYRAPFGLFYHSNWFKQPHNKEGFIKFLDTITAMNDVWIVTNWQALQWMRDPTPLSRINSFQPFQCNNLDRIERCENPKRCTLWHKSGVQFILTCQPCPEMNEQDIHE